jgi:cytoskeletal protein RodZ
MRCPYCDAEVGSEDVYCGECGKRLPATPGVSKRSRWPLILAIIGVLVVACLGSVVVLILLAGEGAPPVTEASPTPEYSPAPSSSSTSLPSSTERPAWPTYSSADLGLTLRYPDDWLFAEDPELKQVVFAPEQDSLQVDEFLRGTSFAVVVNSTEEALIYSAVEALEQVRTFLVDTDAGSDIGEVQPVRIGGQDGVRMTIEGEFSQPGVSFSGWIAAAVAYDHVYVFAAGAPTEEWPQEQATLQAMLDSVALSPPSTTPQVPSPTPGETVVPATPSSTPTFVVPTPVAIEGADAYEPDDTLADAKPIATDGTPQAHNLHVEGDHDYVYFQASGGNAYTIETLGLGAEIDTIIFLYDDQEQELALNDDGTEEALASRIVWVAPSSGTYYVMVRDLSEDSSGPDASYSISVKESTFVEGADPYEPDDSVSEASLIDTDGTPQTHTFHTTTDVDFVWFTAEEGLEYIIETGDLLGDCDTVAYLFDEDGTELTYDDDAGEGGYASRIVWTAPASGIYYAAVTDYAGRAGPDVSYQIWVSSQ